MNFKTLFWLPVLFLACDDQASEEKTSQKEEKPACELTVGTLTDTEWLLLDSNTDKPQLRSRLKFYKDESGEKAKYTAGSFSDIYNYDCTVKENKLTCKEKPDYQQWCETLRSQRKKCSLSAFQKLDPDVQDNEAFQKGVAAGEKAFKAMEKIKGKEFSKYKKKNDDVGNKLQGILHVEVKEKKCSLTVTDSYMTFWDGKKIENTNANGINAFVKNEEGTLLWEECTTDKMFDTTIAVADFPKDPKDVSKVMVRSGEHAVGTEVHYWLYSNEFLYSEENCEYSFDTYSNYKRDQKDLKPEVVEIKKKQVLQWHFAKTYKEASEGDEISMIVAKAKCKDKPERTIVGCNSLLIK